MNKNKVLLGGILLCIFIMVLLNDLMISVSEEGNKSTLFVKAQGQVLADEDNTETLSDIISAVSKNDSLTSDDLKTLEELNNLSSHKKIIDEAKEELIANKLKYETMLSDLKTKVDSIKKEIQTLSKEEDLLSQMIQELEGSSE